MKRQYRNLAVQLKKHNKENKEKKENTEFQV